MKPLLFFCLFLPFSIFSNEKLGGQEIIEKLDRTLAINDGLTYATLSIKKGNHQTHFWKVNIFKQGDDVLYTFEITHRKPVAKLLSIKRGEKLLYYNVLSGKFFQIEQLEKMEFVLHTSFTYLDLNHSLYEADYNPVDVSITKSETSESSIVKMTPISFPSYQYLQLHVDNSDYSPKKIDFTSNDGLLIKTLKFKYGKLKVKQNTSISDVTSLTRLDMIDTSTGYTSSLEFLMWDKDIKPDRILYEMKTMYEK